MADTLTIAATTRAIIAEVLGTSVDKVAEDASLVDDLGADSLDHIELANRLEVRLDIALSDDDTDTWRTARDVIRSVEAKRGAGR